MAVLIYYLFAIIHNLYGFLDIITFLSTKVNYFPYLVYLHQIMDIPFIPLAIKRLFLFSLNNFGSISNKSVGVWAV